MEPSELTIISCNFNTPEEMELMRLSLMEKSEKARGARFILVENSSDEGKSAERWKELG